MKLNHTQDFAKVRQTFVNICEKNDEVVQKKSSIKMIFIKRNLIISIKITKRVDEISWIVEVRAVQKLGAAGPADCGQDGNTDGEKGVSLRLLPFADSCKHQAARHCNNAD